MASIYNTASLVTSEGYGSCFDASKIPPVHSALPSPSRPSSDRQPYRVNKKLAFIDQRDPLLRKASRYM